MSEFCRVAWNEGMFLRPQHFQQQERSIYSRLYQSLAVVNPYFWGIYDMDIDYSLLSNGQFALTRFQGYLPTGAGVLSPERDSLPKPKSLMSEVRDEVIYLAVPSATASGQNLAERETAQCRYYVDEVSVNDTSLNEDTSEIIQIARLNAELKLESEPLAGFDTIAIARIHSVSEEGAVVLDKRYIPPLLNCSAHQEVMRSLNDLHGTLKQRADSLAGRIGSSQSSASSIVDFLMLQVLNRFDGVLSHVLSAKQIHPESLYTQCIELAGELATFSNQSKRTPTLPSYQHDNLSQTLGELFTALSQSMGTVLEQTAHQLPLESSHYGIRFSRLEDKQLLEQAEFVIAVRADITTEELRARFPNQVKVGPVEHIRDLINNQLSGVPVASLPAAPRQVPYHAGFHYFKLDKTSQYWARLKTSGGIAIHLSGLYPELDMQLWAIRQ